MTATALIGASDNHWWCLTIFDTEATASSEDVQTTVQTCIDLDCVQPSFFTSAASKTQITWLDKFSVSNDQGETVLKVKVPPVRIENPLSPL